MSHITGVLVIPAQCVVDLQPTDHESWARWHLDWSWPERRIVYVAGGAVVAVCYCPAHAAAHLAQLQAACAPLNAMAVLAEAEAVCGAVRAPGAPLEAV